MELRDAISRDGEALCEVRPLEIPDFLLFGEPIGPILGNAFQEFRLGEQFIQ